MTRINSDGQQRRMHNPMHTVHWALVVLFFAALPVLVIVALLRQPAALAQPASAPKSGLHIHVERTGLASTATAVHGPLPRIQCAQAHTAIVYAEGLSSPDGLAFGPSGAWGILLSGVLPGRGLGAQHVKRMEVCASAAVGL